MNLALTTYDVEVIEESDGWFGYYEGEPVTFCTQQTPPRANLFRCDFSYASENYTVRARGYSWYVGKKNGKLCWLRPTLSDNTRIKNDLLNKIRTYMSNKLAYPQHIRNGYRKTLSSEHWTINVELKSSPDVNFNEVYNTHDGNFIASYFKQCANNVTVSIEGEGCEFDELRELVEKLYQGVK